MASTTGAHLAGQSYVSARTWDDMVEGLANVAGDQTLLV